MTHIRWIFYFTIVAVLPACSGQFSPLNIVDSFLPTQPPTPTATPTATNTPIPTATPTNTSTPSPTLPPTNTATPTLTPLPTDTATATYTPKPTLTPTAVPATPAPTPVPTNTPEAAVDFRIASWRLWPLALNSGCAKGMHTIFITVLDANGAPLNDIVVGDSWGNVETVSGSKGAGKAEIDLWSNTMEMVVKRHAVTGEVYTSQVSFPFSSFMTTIPNEQMIEAGYCANEAECEWKRQHDSYYCGGHYSWEVVFQKTK